ncbi:MAG: GNAT family N-acetyltransferase [Chloroflexi bacterium]|nr:GNAT family N-acetyltransferase [Chloroflexota bacterium]
MSSDLLRIPFEDRHLNERDIQKFYCGDDRWCRTASTWIRRPRTIAQARSQRTEIWLYTASEGQIVGYGSLGPWRVVESPPEASIIPVLAIRREFQGQPHDQPKNHYSDQLIRDLVTEADRHTERLPVVGPYVDPENHGAIKLYKRHNFEMVPELTSKDGNGIVHVAMLRRLS